MVDELLLVLMLILLMGCVGVGAIYPKYKVTVENLNFFPLKGIIVTGIQ